MWSVSRCDSVLYAECGDITTYNGLCLACICLGRSRNDPRPFDLFKSRILCITPPFLCGLTHLRSPVSFNTSFNRKSQPSQLPKTPDLLPEQEIPPNPPQTTSPPTLSQPNPSLTSSPKHTPKSSPYTNGPWPPPPPNPSPQSASPTTFSVSRACYVTFTPRGNSIPRLYVRMSLGFQWNGTRGRTVCTLPGEK